MKTQNASQMANDVEDSLEEQVETYLREHPAYFSQRPDLLTELQVTHACGGAVSLIEHQVSVLREQNHRLRRRLQELLGNARDNQELSQKLHRLTLALLDCQRLDELLGLLYASLQDDLDAERVAIRLFADPRDPQDQGLAEFVEAGEAGQALLSELEHAGAPLCGRIRPRVAELLFGAEIGSGIILPLGDQAPFGVLAVGSGDPQRYQPGVGTLFLQQLADIARHLIRRHLA